MLGGTRNGPQRKAAGKNGWTAAKAEKFIAVLADSCNVSLAARAIRRSVSSVYVQRSKNADFRRQWDQALATGYSRLELMMLERALHGTEKVVTLKSGESRVMQEYDDRVALALLRLHRDRVSAIDSGVDEQSVDEARERILDRLERMRDRDADKEVKAARDLVRLIGWGVSARRRCAATRR